MSELERLYRLVFRDPPSAEITDVLEVMRTVFGMAKDDPLSQMLVVLLRVADLMNHMLARRTKEERTFLHGIREVTAELTDVTRSLEAIEGRLTKRRIRIPEFNATAWRLPTYRRLSPMLSYFGEAFRLRAGTEDDERIASARWDLAYLFGFVVFMAMPAAWIGKTYLAG